MTITFPSSQVKNFWSTYKTPERITIRDRNYIPIRKLKDKLIREFFETHCYRTNAMTCHNIKLLCEYLKIPIIRPQGMLNLPCIDECFVRGLLNLFIHESDLDGYRHYSIRFVSWHIEILNIEMVNLLEEAKSEVQEYLSMVDLDGIEQVVPVVPL